MESGGKEEGREMQVGRKAPITLGEIALCIVRNCTDMERRRIDWKAFGARQRELWGMVSRGRLRLINSPCDKRYSQVYKHLKRLGWFKAVGTHIGCRA